MNVPPLSVLTVLPYLLVATAAVGADKGDKGPSDYFASGYSLGAGYETLAYFNGPNIIHRYNGGAIELASPNFATPAATANLGVYARVGVYQPVKSDWDQLVTATAGLYWHGLVPGTTHLKTHVQFGLGLAHADLLYALADVLYGCEYEVAGDLGIGVDLHSYVGIDAGAGAALMARYHF